MSGQDLAVLALGLAALGYLLHRWVRRRRASTCCGAPRCPADRALAELASARRR